MFLTEFKRTSHMKYMFCNVIQILTTWNLSISTINWQENKVCACNKVFDSGLERPEPVLCATVDLESFNFLLSQEL